MHRPILAAFERALRLETHHLQRRPDLTWQQLHNRLQWNEGAVGRRLDAERRRRTGSGAGPWFRTGTRVRESESLLGVMAGHEGSVNGCAFSPDGQSIVSGGGDGTVRVWDVASTAEVLVVEGHAGPVNDCAFSSDGTRIASAGADGTVRVWDAESGTPLGTEAGHDGPVNACGFAPDRYRIVSGGSDGTVRVWEPGTDGEPLVLEAHPGGVNDCVFGPDGRRLASTGDDATLGNAILKVWDAETGAEVRSMVAVLFGDERSGRGCAFTPDGARVASLANVTFRERKRHGMEEELGWTLALWDVETGEGEDFPGGHGAHAKALGVGPDGRRIAAAADETVQLWDTADRDLLDTLEGHTGPVLACGFSPDGDRIASAGAEGNVRVWDARRTRRRPAPDRARGWHAGTGALGTLRSWGAFLPDHTDAVWACAFGPDGRRVLTVSATALKLWDPASGEAVRTIRGSIGYFDELPAWAFSPDGRRIVSPGDYDAVTVWDAEDGAEELVLDEEADSVHAVAFTPDGTRIVVAGVGGTLDVWDAGSGDLIAALDHGMTLADWDVSPDGRRIVTGSGLPGDTEKLMEAVLGDSPSDVRPLRLWDAEHGRSLRTVEDHPGGVEACGFSPDGRRIVTVGEDGALRLWDAHDGSCLRTYEGAQSGGVRARSWAFSPDCRLLVTPGDAETLDLWDASDGTRVRPFQGRAGIPKAFAFSPDGRWILTAGWDPEAWAWDGELRVWDVEVGALAHVLEGRAGRLRSFAFSPDGRWVVSAGGGSLGGAADLWETASGNAASTLPLPHTLSAIDVHPSAWMVCGTDDGTVHWAEPRDLG